MGSCREEPPRSFLLLLRSPSAGASRLTRTADLAGLTSSSSSSFASRRHNASSFAQRMHQEDSESSDETAESFESRDEERRWFWRWRVALRFVCATVAREIDAWKIVLLLVAGRWSQSSSRSRRVFAAAILAAVVLFGSEISQKKALSSVLLGVHQRLLPGGGTVFVHHHAEEDATTTSSTASSVERRLFLHDDDDDDGAEERYRTVGATFFHSMSGELWRAGGGSGGGLGAHLGRKASESFRLALGRGLASIADVSRAAVDFGDEPPHVDGARRLRKVPRSLHVALAKRGADAERVVAFELDTTEWRFVSAGDRSFVAADLTLKNTLKYAVPRLGLVLKDAVVGPTKLLVAVEFAATYPFVRHAAATFGSRPTLAAKSFVGSTSAARDEDLVEFEPFAQIIDDELRAALPVARDAVAFDLGAWLTDCGLGSDLLFDESDVAVAGGLLLGWDPPSNDAAFPPAKNTAAQTTAATAQKNSTSSSPAAQPTKRQQQPPTTPSPPRRRGPFTGIRRWAANRRLRRRQHKVAAKQAPAGGREKDSLESQEEAARQRLEDERRKLLEAATAVGRERDNFLAAARSTRQALSDRLFVALKLQLAQEFHSLTRVLHRELLHRPRKDTQREVGPPPLDQRRRRRFHRSTSRGSPSAAPAAP
mmetsp:Transcript_18866/g.58072  ORF Transcript_18866/g.58072 Transcript_18866/m.58072 type:complete len:653 (-) Transcript_18866:252-2210(-)